MHRNKILTIFFFFFLNKFGVAGNSGSPTARFTSCEMFESSCCHEYKADILSTFRPNPILKLFRANQKKKKQILAALLAFPLPFGIVGLHRIYLGCAPYVPVAYIASLGGMFGVLPFIDFWVLIIKKDIDNYSGSKKIFMWVN